MRVALIRGVSSVLAAALAHGASAQDTTRAARADTIRRPVTCTGQRVNDIIIHSFAPTIAALRSVRVVADVARSIHATTRPDLVRRRLGIADVGLARLRLEWADIARLGALRAPRSAAREDLDL